MLPPDISRAIDDAMKHDLQDWRDLWFNGLLVSTFIVGLGLAFEGPELWFEIRDIIGRRRDRRRFFMTWTTDPPDWMTVLAFAGWILIVLGVMGEGALEAMVSKADGNLQTFNGIVLAEAQKESGIALERAASANMLILGLKQDVAKATTEMAKQQTRAATAEKDLLDLKERIKPRKLSDQQCIDFVKTLKTFPNEVIDFGSLLSG